jgi:tripartite-type tricarboxylate transporter receptor subunit TctC
LQIRLAQFDSGSRLQPILREINASVVTPLRHFFATFATVRAFTLGQYTASTCGNVSTDEEITMRLKKRLFVSAALAGLLNITATWGWAQSAYPDKPVKLVIPFAAGGATDVLGRLLAVSMQEKLGQSVVVENKPGAGTVLAASLVAKAPADGYTLLLASNSTLVLNPVIRDKLSYHPVNSFTPIAMVADMQLLLVTGPSGPASLAAVVAQAKADPNALNYGSFGTGSTVHFAAELLKSAAGIQMTHVPYNGSGPSLSALMGGQVSMSSDTIVASMPLIKAGKIRPLAVFSSQRLKALPDVPTMGEAGYPNVELSSWFALMAPKDLPAPVRQKLEKTLADVLAQPEVRAKLVDVGLQPNWGSAAAVTVRMQNELPRMLTVAQRAAIKDE